MAENAQSTPGSGFGKFRSTVLARLRRNVSLTACAYVLDDWQQGQKLIKSIGVKSYHPTLDARYMWDYGVKVWQDYCAKAGAAPLAGRVAELGPGDNDVVAWLLLANGTKEVHHVDRFAAQRDDCREAELRQLASQDPGVARIIADGAATPAGLHRHNCAAEEYFQESKGAFDAIISRAVLEHLTDPIGALDSMAQALRPGGVMVHFVDLRDHGMFSGRPLLTFLTVRDGLWPLMTRNSARPNRVVFSRYRDWLAKSGLSGELRVTLLAGNNGQVDLASFDDAPDEQKRIALNEVAKVRSRLAASLRNDSDEDLAVASLCLIARAPG